MVLTQSNGDNTTTNNNNNNNSFSHHSGHVRSRSLVGTIGAPHVPDRHHSSRRLLYPPTRPTAASHRNAEGPAAPPSATPLFSLPLRRHSPLRVPLIFDDHDQTDHDEDRNHSYNGKDKDVDITQNASNEEGKEDDKRGVSQDNDVEDPRRAPAVAPVVHDDTETRVSAESNDHKLKIKHTYPKHPPKSPFSPQPKPVQAQSPNRWLSPLPSDPRRQRRSPATATATATAAGTETFITSHGRLSTTTTTTATTMTQPPPASRPPPSKPSPALSDRSPSRTSIVSKYNETYPSSSSSLSSASSLSLPASVASSASVSASASASSSSFSLPSTPSSIRSRSRSRSPSISSLETIPDIPDAEEEEEEEEEDDYYDDDEDIDTPSAERTAGQSSQWGAIVEDDEEKENSEGRNQDNHNHNHRQQQQQQQKQQQQRRRQRPRQNQKTKATPWENASLTGGNSSVGMSQRAPFASSFSSSSPLSFSSFSPSSSLSSSAFGFSSPIRSSSFARDKRKRWSVCGAERRGDFDLETIWED